MNDGWIISLVLDNSSIPNWITVRNASGRKIKNERQRTTTNRFRQY